MRWPWPPHETLTAEQRAHVDDVSAAWKRAWDSDWGPALAAMAKATGLSRAETMLFVVCMRLEALPVLLERIPEAHQAFRPDCEHCIAARAQQELVNRYMERALKYMDKEQHGDDWKPIP